MFFSEEEMKIAEDLSWKMLDGWNHSYMANLMNYAFFYYKNRVVMDPWMRETAQSCLWPDHESKETKVDPVKYYGEETIESFVVRLFMLRPEWALEITKKIQGRLSENGVLIKYSPTYKEMVFFAISDQQAEEEHRRVCIGDELPESSRIYYALDKIPRETATVIEFGWKKEIVFPNKNIKKVMNYLYPDGLKWNYQKYINRCMGREVRIIGFGD